METLHEAIEKNNCHEQGLGSRGNERVGENQNRKVGRPPGLVEAKDLCLEISHQESHSGPGGQGNWGQKADLKLVFLSKAEFRTTAGGVGVVQGDHSLGQGWEMPSVWSSVKRESLKVGKELPCTRSGQAEAGTGPQGSLMPGEASCRWPVPGRLGTFLGKSTRSLFSLGLKEAQTIMDGLGVPLDCFSRAGTSSRHLMKTWQGRQVQTGSGLDQAVDIMGMWPLGTGNSVLEVHSLGGWNTNWQGSVFSPWLGIRMIQGSLFKKITVPGPRSWRFWLNWSGEGPWLWSFFLSSLSLERPSCECPVFDSLWVFVHTISLKNSNCWLYLLLFH